MKRLIEGMEFLAEAKSKSGGAVKKAYKKWRQSILDLADHLESVVSSHYDGRYKVRVSISPSQDAGTPEVLGCQVKVYGLEVDERDNALKKKLESESGMSGWTFAAYGSNMYVEAEDIPK